MTNQPDRVPAGVDNFRADQAILAVDPNARIFARANRDFFGQAVRLLGQVGIGQCLDIGSGIPTEGNVHAATKIHMRSRATSLRFFDGFELVDPGLVFVPECRPGAPGDVPADPGRYRNLVGVARKP
jgi:S-adenosyl methyltransferase